MKATCSFVALLAVIGLLAAACGGDEQKEPPLKLEHVYAGQLLTARGLDVVNGNSVYAVKLVVVDKEHANQLLFGTGHVKSGGSELAFVITLKQGDHFLTLPPMVNSRATDVQLVMTGPAHITYATHDLDKRLYDHKIGTSVTERYDSDDYYATPRYEQMELGQLMSLFLSGVQVDVTPEMAKEIYNSTP